MRPALLDVNVLLALLDVDHVNHERAHEWANEGLRVGWATCALTQNGFVRIISQPGYPNPLSVPAAAELLKSATEHPQHAFWPCDIRLTDDLIRSHRLLGPRQVTDTYLLALATAHDGRLVSFDARIDLLLVEGARADHLVVL